MEWAAVQQRPWMEVGEEQQQQQQQAALAPLQAALLASQRCSRRRGQLWTLQLACPTASREALAEAQQRMVALAEAALEGLGGLEGEEGAWAGAWMPQSLPGCSEKVWRQECKSR
jgi:hypothetical protein